MQPFRDMDPPEALTPWGRTREKDHCRDELLVELLLGVGDSTLGL